VAVVVGVCQQPQVAQVILPAFLHRKVIAVEEMLLGLVAAEEVLELLELVVRLGLLVMVEMDRQHQ
jgi:hypothetical protein